MTPDELNHLKKKIRQFLILRNWGALRRYLENYNPIDLADVMESSLTPKQIITCLQVMKGNRAAEILLNLGADLQVACLKALPPASSSKLLRSLAVDDAVDLLQELDQDLGRKILAEMPFDENTQTIHHLLLEDPETAAGIMSTDFIQLSIEDTVADALQQIRRARRNDFIYYCYLVDSQDKLVGVVSLKEILGQQEDTPLKAMATFDVKSILTTFDQELVANLFRKYDNLLAIPVVDPEDVLRGVITVDDVLYVIDEETSEDIYRSSGINIEEIDEKNLLTGPSILAVKARLPWLSVTLFGQFLAATIIATHSKTVATATIAISFMPLLTGLSGNMGTQSDTIAVRGLALNQITDDNIMAKLLREMRVALITGSFFSVIVGILSFLQYHHWQLSALLSSWILFSLCLSASMGMMVPYAYRRFFKQDPAGVGGPFITTASDIVTFSVYLYVLTIFLDKMI